MTKFQKLGMEVGAESARRYLTEAQRLGDEPVSDITSAQLKSLRDGADYALRILAEAIGMEAIRSSVNGKC